MQNIKIEDLHHFEELLTSISKITGGCRFNVDETGCTVNVKTETESVRGYFKSTCLIAEEPIFFCLTDISKLTRAIKVVSDNRRNKLDAYIRKRIDVYKTNNPDAKIKQTELKDKFSSDFKAKESDFFISYQHPFLKFSKDGVKFSFSTVKPEVVEYTGARSLSRELTNIHGFVITDKNITKASSLSSITNLAKPRVYMYKEKTNGNEYIVAEINDKTLQVSDSVGIPVSNKFDGEWLDYICVPLEAFKLFNIIPSEEISVNMTKERMIIVNSSNEYNTVKLIVNSYR
jgi:hypothetical protein